jgi:transcriptional regulator
MARERMEILQGTLDMLILRTLLFGPRHGHAIATTIEHTSDDVLQVDHGSLYPALQRLERQKLIASEWGTSDNNRRAKFYRLTAPGRKTLNRQNSRWAQFIKAVAGVMNVAEDKS